MKEYIKGTKFIVCGHDELLKKGWYLKSPNHYYHKDFLTCQISRNMIDTYQGDTLTVTKINELHKNWYEVEEQLTFIWPVATFLSVDGAGEDPKNHFCEEGATPIYGWIICKTCGIDLRKIR